MRTIAFEIVEQEFGERFRKLGLADAGGPKEQERAQRPVRVLQAGAGAAHRGGHRLHRILLADDARADRRFHLEQLLALAFHHPLDRNSRPAADHAGDVLTGHFLAQHRALGRAPASDKLLFKLRNAAVLKLAGLGEIAAALGLLELDPGRVELLLDLGLAGDLVLFRLPALGQLGRLLVEVGKLLLELGQPVLGRPVPFLLQRLALDLQLDDPAVEILDFLGLGLDLHPDPAGGLVHQVDRLVGEEAVGDVAVAERRRRDDRGIGDAHAVVKLVFLLEAAQDRDRVRDRRLADEHRLEAPFERGVLLDIFAIFVERSRADAVQLAARQRRLQKIAGVHRAFGFAGADQRVHFVDEQDDLAGGLTDLIEHALQPLFEVAAILRAGDDRAHVEREQPPVLDAVGYVAVGDAQREAFGDRGLADAGLADQHRIVLGAPREDLDRAADFLVAADHRVELALARRLGQVARIFLERVVAVLGTLRVGGAAAAQLVDRGVEILRGHPRLGQRCADVAVLGQRHREQDPLDGNVTVIGLLRDLLGLVEDADGVAVERGRLRRAAAGDRGDFGDQRIGFRAARPWGRRRPPGSAPRPCLAHRRAAPSANARARSAGDARGPRWSARPEESRARGR